MKERTHARPVPLFLIEDNRLLRDGLASMLSSQGLSVVATARSGQEALREVARVKPQLVLLDPDLRLFTAPGSARPEMRGIAGLGSRSNDDLPRSVLATV